MSIGIWEAAVLGVVEGLTEFLPVSSTGHLRVTESFLGLQVDAPEVVAFTAVIQTGAIGAVLVYFARDIGRIAAAWLRGLVSAEHRGKRDYRFGWWIILATIPIVVVGVAAAPLINGPLASLLVVALSLIVGSFYMLWADRVAAAMAARDEAPRGEEETTLADAMIVGSSQILALLFPGFSRSGASISTGLLRGLDRVAATRLSFFLSIPALVGAGLYELKNVTDGSVPISSLVVGTGVSFVVAYASIAWLLRFVGSHNFTGFIIYRLVIGVALLVLLATGTIAT